MSCSPASSRRDSRIGTVMRASALCSCSAFQVNSGSVLRAVTRVLPRPSASIDDSSPQAWKPGAASTTVRPARSGILDRYPPGSARDSAMSRGAPFGVPVVPLVSSTSFCFDDGRGGRPVSPDSISELSVSSLGSPSCQATYLPAGTSTLSATSANSSSWISALTPSRSQTSLSWGPAKSVLSSRVGAPSLAPAKMASQSPRWLRHMTPTASLDPTPRSRSALASALLCRSSCVKVMAPSSSTIAVPTAVRRGGQRDGGPGRPVVGQIQQRPSQLVRRRHRHADAAGLDEGRRESGLESRALRAAGGRSKNVHGHVLPACRYLDHTSAPGPVDRPRSVVRSGLGGAL